MSYTTLWGSPDILLKQSSSNRLIFDSFISLIQKRVEVEEEYSRELLSLAESCQKIIKRETSDSSLIFVLSAFKSNVSRRASQTIEFSKQLREEIIAVLKEFLRKQNDEVGMIEKQLESLEYISEPLFSKMKKSKTKIYESHKQREEQFVNLEILKARLVCNKDDEDKLVNRVRKAEKEFLVNEGVAKDVFKQYNAFIVKYYAELDKNLLRLQKHEVDRFNQMNNNMKKILVFQVSMMKNFQYDVTNLSTQLDAAGAQSNRDVEETVKRYKKEGVRRGMESIPKFNFVDAVLLGMIQKELEKKIKLDKNEEIRGVVMKISAGVGLEESDRRKMEKERIEVLEKLVGFMNSGEEVSGEKFKEGFDELFDIPENRTLAQLLLRTKIQSLQFQTTQIHLLVIQFLLQKCYRKKDMFCIRGILKIIFTQLTMKTPKRKSQILYGQLINSRIWNDGAFWSALLFESVQEHLKIFRSKKSECYQEALVQEESVILSQMMHSCHIMLMLGFQTSKVKTIAERYVRFYEMSQNGRVKILKLINESACSYNEIWNSSSHELEQEIDLDYD